MMLSIRFVLLLLALSTLGFGQSEHDAARFQKILYTDVPDAWRMFDDAFLPGPVNIGSAQTVEVALGVDELGVSARVHRIRPLHLTRGELLCYLKVSPYGQWAFVGLLTMLRDTLILDPPVPATALRIVGGLTATIDGNIHVYSYNTSRPMRITSYSWYGVAPSPGAFLSAGVELTLNPNADFFAIIFGAVLAPLSTSPISLPIWQGGMLLDPAYVFPIASRLTSGASSWPFGIPFFYDPAMAGIDFHIQAAVLNQALTTAYWTRPLTFTS